MGGCLSISKATWFSNYWFSNSIILWVECGIWPHGKETKRRLEGLTFCVQSDTNCWQATSFLYFPARMQCSQLPSTFIWHRSRMQFQAVRTEQNLDHSCCWWESPRDTPFRQNAKAIFGCTALNSITEDSARAKPGTAEANRRQRPDRALRPRAAVFQAWGQELLLDEARTVTGWGRAGGSLAGQQIQAQSAMAVVTQSLYLRANPVRTEPHSQAYSVVGWLCVSAIGFKFVFFIHAQK